MNISYDRLQHLLTEASRAKPTLDDLIRDTRKALGLDETEDTKEKSK